MKAAISYTAKATDDLERIRHHYSREGGVELAERMLQEILDAIRGTVATFPTCGRLRPELGPHVRSYPCFPYVIFYRVRGRAVRVARVLHGKRDIQEPLMSLLLAG